MIKKLLPILLALIGLVAGVGGGMALRPDPEIVSIDPCGDMEPSSSHQEDMVADSEEEGASGFEYVKLNNQFIVPDLDNGRVTAMVVLSLSLEAKTGAREAIYAREPKLRDAFLQVLFDHANTGGFKGAFTDSGTMNNLRNALTEIAQKTIGDEINDVLVIDIVRQDVK
jgi:flagellar FliL protein